MRISLIDHDSKIPNLALMKISAYHKSIGDTVGLNLSSADKVYHSIVFNKNKGKSLNGVLTDADHVYGGSGFDISVKLPDTIEFMKPDYDLYPSEYSMGFSSRGCNRNCYFCIVPSKEGKFKRWQHPKEFYDERFKKLVLLDNNILFDRDWAIEILNWCVDNNIKLDMTQGYDIRLLDHEIADLILSCRSDIVHFAFDDTRLESIIRTKVDLLKDVGFNLKNNVTFFCYCNDDSMFNDTLYRCNVLKSLGTNADVMFNCDMIKTDRIKALMKWSWRKCLYWKIDFENYSKVLHT